MNVYTRNAILSGILFGILMGLFFTIQMNIFSGMITGSLSGIVFGIIIGIFTKTMGEKMKKNRPDIISGKLILKEGGANHFIRNEAVGGWIILTKEELIFTSHSFNIQNHELIIPLDEIVEVNATLTWGLIPNGLKILTKNNKFEQFVVNNNKNWVENILKAKNS